MTFRNSDKHPEGLNQPAKQVTNTYVPQEWLKEEDRHAAAAAKSESLPNFARRRAVAGVVAVLALTGAFKGGEALVDHIKDNNLAAELKHDGDKAPLIYEDGGYKGKDVSEVEFSQAQSAQAAAANLTPNDKDLLETRDILMPQTGDYIDAGEKAVLPNDLLKPKYEDPK